MNESEQQHTYLDPDGFSDYKNRGGLEIRIEKHVQVPADVAWETWFTSIWEGQTGPKMLDPGNGPGRLGSTRTVRLAGITERIVSVGVPSPSNQPQAIPSISYTLENFVATSYLGYVQFVPTGSNAATTQIVWRAKWTPSLAGRLFLGGRPLVRMLQSAMRQALEDLERQATAQRQL